MHSTSSAELLKDSFQKLSPQIPQLLSDYLRIDTSNPPGDVSLAVDFVEEILNAEGIPTKRLGPSVERANVVATLESTTDTGHFILSHHMDVVPAPIEGWSVDPFGGAIAEGFVWGRGALDMKGFGILTLLCAIALKRIDMPLRRGLRIVASADEEIGGLGGAKWLTENSFEEVSGDYLLTEGGYGNVRRRFTYYRVQTAEKGVSTVRLVALGRPGHASAPRTDNPVVRIARALSKISDYRSPIRSKEFAARFVDAFPPSMIGLDGVRPADLDADQLEELVSKIERRKSTNVMRNTFTPTIVEGGFGQNVIPAVCEAFVDCRSLPGVTGQQIVEELSGVIDDPEVQLELVKTSEGTESPDDSDLMCAIRTAVEAERPGAFVVPYLNSGGSDAKHFRAKGVTCYGLIPFEFSIDSETARVHGIDERVSIENLEQAFRILLHLVCSMCL